MHPVDLANRTGMIAGAEGRDQEMNVFKGRNLSLPDHHKRRKMTKQ